MHYSQRLASIEFSKAQIVVNDSKLPRGFEISAVWGSFFVLRHFLMDSFQKGRQQCDPHYGQMGG